MLRKLIAYYRVSTARQGKSGLGLEAQEASVREFADREGRVVVASYTEIESGKRAHRPELQKAIAHARRARGTLIVAKLDRLSRNASFLLTLQDSGLPLVFCDLPGANELTIGIMALVAQQEAKLISQRTREALAAAKRRGVRLGSARPGHWEGREDKRQRGIRKAAKIAAKVNREAARAAYQDILPMMQALRAEGRSLQAIADALNEQGHETRRGKPWNREQVRLVLRRAAEGA